MSAETVKRGSYSIPNGADSLTLTGLALPFEPTAVKASVHKLTAGGLNLTAWTFGVPTSDGFSVELSGATDAVGYVLDWEAWTDVGLVIDNTDSLALVFADLVDAVRRFLGYGATMTDDQEAEVDHCIQSGYRQFLYPPASEGHEAGYEWSFLRPSATLMTAEGDGVMDLPADFGRTVGDLFFVPGVSRTPAVHVSEARIQTLLQQSTDKGVPRCFTTRFTQAAGTHGQRQEVMFWPVPADIYSVTYRYEAFSGKLSTINPIPLGGMRYAELITESCLAIAEQRSNDDAGLHTERFLRLLPAGIAMDRRAGARYFGHMGSQGDDVVTRGRSAQSSYDITYKGGTW
jgi:hypothetical protein